MVKINCIKQRWYHEISHKTNVKCESPSERDSYFPAYISTREDSLFMNMKSYSNVSSQKKINIFFNIQKSRGYQLSSVSIALREETRNGSVSNTTNSVEDTRSFPNVATATTRTTNCGSPCCETPLNAKSSPTGCSGQLKSARSSPALRVSVQRRSVGEIARESRL